MIVEAKNGTADAIYAWHLYYIDALAVRFRASDQHYFLHDDNFNVTAAYDVNPSSGTYRQVVERYRYTPYGEVTFLNPDFSVKTTQTSAIGNNYLYTGRERDPETGLQLNRHRYYHPGLGRWLTRDPIGYEGSEWNLYEYVNGMPIIGTDPFGLTRAECVAGCRRDFSKKEPPTAADGMTLRACIEKCIDDFPPPPTPDEQNLIDACDKAAAKCPDCSAEQCKRIVYKIIRSVNKTGEIYFGWNTCERWVNRFEKNIYTEIKVPIFLSPCIDNAGPEVHDIGGILAPRHVTYCITFCDGTKICFDNGAWGGDDHIFPGK